jgi:hypothetical protein
MSRNWVAVASADHVRIGRSSGFMQVCHGKAAPLRRVQPGDRVVYYSPSGAFGGRDRLQSFTAIGVVDSGAPYQADMAAASRRSAVTSPGAAPRRRRSSRCRPAPFHDGAAQLGISTSLRTVRNSGDDMAVIATAMGRGLEANHLPPAALPGTA